MGKRQIKAVEQNQVDDQRSTGTLELCTLPVQTSLVSQSPISGRLDRQTYVQHELEEMERAVCMHCLARVVVESCLLKVFDDGS